MMLIWRTLQNCSKCNLMMTNHQLFQTNLFTCVGLFLVYVHCWFPWNFHCNQESWLWQFEPVGFSDESQTFRFHRISHIAHFRNSFFLQSLHFCGFFTVTFLLNFCKISDLAKHLFPYYSPSQDSWGKSKVYILWLCHSNSSYFSKSSFLLKVLLFCGIVTILWTVFPWPVQSVKFSAESPITFTFLWIYLISYFSPIYCFNNFFNQ